MVRFDKPCRLVTGAVEYFREHMQVGEYLTEGQTVPMTWFGAGAERLGLSGICQLADFEALCRGRHPITGANLFVRAKADRRVCFFGQLSAPKDVSIALLVGGDRRIAGWWETAVQETLAEMEATAATRVRQGGACTDRPTANLVASVVTHDTSRALDPQLHTHVSIMNATWDAIEGRWKGLQPDGLFRAQSYLREVCYNRLAASMVAAGYEIEPAKLGFTIKGFPAELRILFSKRRQEIMAEAKSKGAKHQNALQTIAGRSRAAKIKTSAAVLTDGWRREAGLHLAQIEAVIARANGGRWAGGRVAAEPAALASACAHLYERHSVVTERELLREALRAGRGRVVLPRLRAELEQRVATGTLIRDKGAYVSPEALAAESECIQVARDGRDDCARLGAPPEKGGLSDDQFAAVTQLLNSRDRVTVLQGDAGTGKTTSLRALVTAIRFNGHDVFGCAPSAGAADVLRAELTPSAETLQQLLVNESLQRQLAGKVVIVDEAGLISIRQMRDLCRLAITYDYRLVLVGDTKQHTAVEAGDALRALSRFARLPVARLTRIRRQRDPRYRAAVAALARGDVAIAFRRFDKLGAVRTVSPGTLFQATAAAYLESINAGRSCLVICPVWSEIHAFSAEVRDQLRAAKRLGAEERTIEVIDSYHWTREQMRLPFSYTKGDAITFHRCTAGFLPGDIARVKDTGPRGLLLASDAAGDRWVQPMLMHGIDVGSFRAIPVSVGDRLLIRANLVTAGLKNGDLVEARNLSGDGRIELADGRFIPAGFGHFTHGYATTSHAAQGKTIDHGILLLGPQAIQAANLKQAYVSNSRFREKQLIYTTDKLAALEAMERITDRPLAVESLTTWPDSQRGGGKVVRFPRPAVGPATQATGT
jgi:conjugative relaxase-like TrwC/TraI family protein